MYQNDQMTPKERLTAFAKGEEIDRTPIMPFLSIVGCKIAGMTMREVRTRGINEALMQMACYERLGNDNLAVDCGLHIIGIGLGSQTNDPENAVPALTSFVLDDLRNLPQLDANLLTLANNIEFQKHYEAADMLLDKLGHESGVDVAIPGPFTAAASIYSTTRLLKALYKEPENIHNLLRFCTDALINLCKQFRQLDVSFTLCDPIASGSILSPDQYNQFVFPYTFELVEAIHQTEGGVGYHICGDTSKIMESMVKTGIDLLSVDNLIDLEVAKHKVGSKICLIGNVDPVNVMMLGKVTNGIHDIETSIKQCFSKASDSPCGYILSTGCDIPFDTPVENVDLFMEIGRKYGKWPLDSNLFK